MYVSAYLLSSSVLMFEVSVCMDLCFVPVTCKNLVSAIVHAGMLKVAGVMPPKCKMFDTPGVPHKFQLTSRLSADEVWPALQMQRSVHHGQCGADICDFGHAASVTCCSNSRLCPGSR